MRWISGIDKFRIVLKKQDKGHNVESVVRDHIPSLEHGHDGLIFTCAQTGYVAGTDEKM
jgi:mRNA guanylyltransferase